jgi:hypothetical protein
MSVEALWTREFGLAGRWENGGVVVFETGRVFGGDCRYYYVGEFATVADRIEASAQVAYSSVTSGSSISRRRFDLYSGIGWNKG